MKEDRHRGESLPPVERVGKEKWTMELSPHLAPVLESLHTHGCTATVQRVGYEFQKGGNQMLCVSAGPV